MNSDGGGASGTGGSGLTSTFNGTALAEWGSSNSGNGGLNDGGALPLVLLVYNLVAFQGLVEEYWVVHS